MSISCSCLSSNSAFRFRSIPYTNTARAVNAVVPPRTVVALALPLTLPLVLSLILSLALSLALPLLCLLARTPRTLYAGLVSPYNTF